MKPNPSAPVDDAGCPFCRIAREEAPAEVVYRDDSVVAFRDNRPVAPTHILLIPVRHLDSLEYAGEADAGLLGRLLMVAREVAHREGVADTGYRLVINTGGGAGQSVFHLHMHLLARRPMNWPPG